MLFLVRGIVAQAGIAGLCLGAALAFRGGAPLASLAVAFAGLAGLLTAWRMGEAGAGSSSAAEAEARPGWPGEWNLVAATLAFWAVTAFLCLPLLAVVPGLRSVGALLVAAALAGGAGLAAWAGTKAAQGGEPIEIRTHWGGLGGGLGGLQVSRPAGLFLLAVLLGAGSLGALHVVGS